MFLGSCLIGSDTGHTPGIFQPSALLYTVYVLQSCVLAWIPPVTLVPRLRQLRFAPLIGQSALGVVSACHTGTRPVLRVYTMGDATQHCATCSMLRACAIDDVIQNRARSITHRLFVRVRSNGFLGYHIVMPTPGCPHFKTRAMYEQRRKPRSPA